MNHIEQTIADLTAARDRAQSLIEHLREFHQGLNPATFYPTLEAARRQLDPTAAPVPQRTAKPTKPRPPVAPKPGRSRQGTAQSAALLAVVAKLPEPFTPSQLAAAARVKLKTASNFIGRRLETGVVMKRGHGQYGRGPKFPGAPGGSAPAPVTENGHRTVTADASGQAVLQSLGGSFTVLDVQARLDDPSQAGRLLAEWRRRDWIEPASAGAWKRREEGA